MNGKLIVLVALLGMVLVPTASAAPCVLQNCIVGPVDVEWHHCSGEIFPGYSIDVNGGEVVHQPCTV